ncbi:hypothetical protein [Paenibacillus tepidiphilus]|uniref:hypothetical protein n=1 Tax=Paenibacillus tepidiphilus TaxID=2608683 RepID=UPI0012388A9A|nr:hypothetical protein [Paenibacillus tepidiphilus]
MLKLLKYDFRRERDRILAMFAVALLVQLGLWISRAKLDDELLALNTMIYVALGIGMIVTAVRIYLYNLKAYHRQLLPERTLWKLLSPLLLLWMLLLAVELVAVLHVAMYVQIYTTDFFPSNVSAMGPVILFSVLWTCGFLLIMLMLVIAVVGSLRVRGKVWIGILMAVGLQNGYAYLENWLFGPYSLRIDQILNMEYVPAQSSPVKYLAPSALPSIWPLLFELATAGLMLWAIHYLVKNKLEDRA